MSVALKWLRPCLRKQIHSPSQAASSTYLRFYNVVRSYTTEHDPPNEPPIRTTTTGGIAHGPAVEPRIRSAQALKYNPESYPRITAQEGAIDYGTFIERYRGLKKGESSKNEVVVRGM